MLTWGGKHDNESRFSTYNTFLQQHNAKRKGNMYNKHVNSYYVYIKTRKGIDTH